MISRQLYLLILIVSLIISGCSSQPPKSVSSEITIPELQQHIKYLASRELGGRRSAELGNQMAARYIADEFKQYGLTPVGDNGSYFQEFRFTSAIEAGPDNKLLAETADKKLMFTKGVDFRPLAFSTDTALHTTLVFVGYGITDTSLQYDDYNGIDVKGKIVVMLRYTPEGKKTDSKYFTHAAVRTKAFNAREHGAAGMIMITGPADEEKPVLYPLTFDRGMGTSGIAAMTMTWTSFNSILQISGNDIKSIQEKINSSKTPNSFSIAGVSVTMQTDIKKIQKPTSNVLAFLEGSDPVLKKEVIVIGAHFDHLGMGGEGSGSLRPDTLAVHHGADDNASGTSGLLELAQNLAAQRHSLKRSFLFAAFSGEEIGLLGSDYYVKHPTLPLSETIAMINLDMIGRVKDSVLVVEGIGTSPGFEELLRKENTDLSIVLKLKQDGYGPSDHASFYSKDIPVLFFFTNIHDDYHRPSDTWDKINYHDQQKVVSLVSRVGTNLASLASRPAFTKVATPTMANERRGVQVSLGVVPDYAEDIEGLKISGTRAGSAAEKAGLKADDIIIKFDGKDIKNIYDFTSLLGAYKPGDEVVIVVKRGKDEVSLTAKLQGRQ